MSISGALALYFIVWWITLFAMLPIGVRSQHEDGPVIDATEPGAPQMPMIAKKALWTTLAAIPVATAIYAWIVFVD